MFHATRLCAIAATSLLAAGCGGRAAHPVVLDQPFDARLSCAHLAGELSNNEKRLDELQGERDGKPAYNAGMLVVSPLMLDLSDTQREEAKALVARNERLSALMAEKSCA